MIALLDVSTLVALMDTKHALHDRARTWWHSGQRIGWASCPMTQNGFLRIVTLPVYPNKYTLAEAFDTLRRAITHPAHTFWPDDISLLDEAAIDQSQLLSPKHLTDVYLLALAVKNGGRLVTLDTKISRTAARGARAEQLVVV